MSVLLAIDPGRCTGWAFSVDGRIRDAGVLKYDPWGRVTFVNHSIYQPDTVVIEYPCVRRGRSSKGDPNDLIPLAGQAWTMKFFHETFDRCKVHLVTPEGWKGQLDKKVHHAQLWPQLTTEERAAVSAAALPIAESYRHNLYDAVALAVWGARQYQGRKNGT